MSLRVCEKSRRFDFFSITYVCPGAPAPCVNLTVAQAQALRNLEPAYAYLWDTNVNSPEVTCIVMSVSLPFDPLDDAAVPWLANARRVAAHYSSFTSTSCLPLSLFVDARC
jgi:hypothetical protein